MTVYYLDASAFSKRFLKEPGSQWMNERIASGAADIFTSSDLVAVEVVSALARAQREKRISIVHRDRAIEQTHEEVVSLLQTVQVSESIIRSAGSLAVRHALRAYDAIHLATALQVGDRLISAGLSRSVFVSADSDLLAAAQSEGLQVDNPNHHA